MRHNGRAPILASRMRPEQLSLREGEPRLAVCPECETWRRLTRSMIAPHRVSADVPKAGERRHMGDKPSGGRRCSGSAQRITLDITPEQWGKRLLEADMSAAARRSTKVLPKVKSQTAPPVMRIAPAPISAEAARQALRQHRQECLACKGEIKDRDGQRTPLPCRDGERLAVTYLRLLRQEPKRRTARDAFARERRRFDRQYAAAAPARRVSEWATVLPAVTAADARRTQLPVGDAPAEAPSVPLMPLHPARDPADHQPSRSVVGIRQARYPSGPER